MEDAEYLFKQDVKEKKRNSWGARNMHRTGKGAVRFPSDYLTPKEKKKLNGPITSYDMGKPMTYEQFKALPFDIQSAYLLGLLDKYNPSQRQIAEMLGISQRTVSYLLTSHGIHTKNAGNKCRSDDWKKFTHPDLEGEVVEAMMAEPVEPIEEFVPKQTPILPEEEDFYDEEDDRPVRPKPTTRREHILERAKACVMGDREQDYGSPEDNFKTIADMWNAYLGTNWLKPKDVAAMLALLKIARIASGHGKEDNWIDLAGYAACGGELEDAGRE